MDQSMNEDKKSQKSMTLHYAFAHMILRDIVINQSDNFKKVFDQGPESLKGYLVYLWNEIKNTNPQLRNQEQVINEDSFDVSLSEVKTDQKLLNIVMPKIKEAPEAIIVSVLFAEELRYFTLEYENNAYTGESFMVCEWQRGGKHKNYGKVNNPRPGVFAGKIEEIIK